jgi:hypothetical protein
MCLLCLLVLGKTYLQIMWPLLNSFPRSLHRRRGFLEQRFATGSAVQVRKEKMHDEKSCL